MRAESVEGWNMSRSLCSFSFEANSKVLGTGPPVPALSLQLAKIRHCWHWVTFLLFTTNISEGPVRLPMAVPVEELLLLLL